MRPEDGVSMDTGFGPNGASVQVFPPGQGIAWKTDREIVRYTVLKGKIEVKASEISQNLRHVVETGGKKQRVGLPTKVWEQVMEAA